MATKTRRADKFFVDAEGKQSKSPTEDWQHVRFHTFFADGRKDDDDKPVVEFTREIARADIPEAVFAMAAGHGIAQKIGDEYANAKNRDNPVVETIETMIERLVGGEWNMERGAGSGPRPTMVMEAVKRGLMELGESEDRATEIATQATATKEGREQVLTDPMVKSHFEEIKLEKAKERAKEAKAAAKKAAESGEGLLASLAQ